jgi:hypothetical protein
MALCLFHPFIFNPEGVLRRRMTGSNIIERTPEPQENHVRISRYISFHRPFSEKAIRCNKNSRDSKLNNRLAYG